MASRDAALDIRTLAQDPVPVRVRASGEWTFRGLKEPRLDLARRLAELEKQPGERVAWDLTAVEELDDAGAVWLAHALRKAQHIEVAPRHREILDQVGQGLRVPVEPERFDPLAGVVWTGNAAAGAADIVALAKRRRGANQRENPYVNKPTTRIGSPTSDTQRFRMRGKDGETVFSPPGTSFQVLRTWKSPRTGTPYPVSMRVNGYDLEPLMDDQELDARASTGTIYWEGAVRALRNGREAGRGYLELTGYWRPMKI